MYLGSTLTVITSCFAGLMFGTVAMAQERAGLFIPRPGMQFTTAFTNDFGKDAESNTTVTAVTNSAVSIEYSSSRGVSVRRDLLVADRRDASSYVLGDVTPAFYPAGTGIRSSLNAPDERPSSSSFWCQRVA